MAQNVNVIERDGLRMHVFVSEPVIFETTSVVLEGKREVALIDAQFSANNARRVVELIRSTGKPLTKVFISYSDPDYYFGLDRIASAFPKAEIIATPQTVWMIDATKEEKMKIWVPQLGENAPEKIITPAGVKKDHFTFDGRRIEIRQLPGDEQHAWLWIPSVRTILGGVYLSDNEHLWVADSPLEEDRAKWIAALDAMAELEPESVIPAHFTPPQGDDPIAFTRRYLVALESVLANSKTSTAVITAMKTLFPELGGEENLEMSAKVLKGEMPWSVTSAFPAIGRKVEVDFGGEYQFELDFHNEYSMSFRGLKQRGGGRPMSDTVEYTAVEVARGVYMVYWTEKNNTHVVHIEDYGRGVAYTNISAPDGSFTNLRGTLKLLDE